MSGWNQWVKCVQPRSIAHSFMAEATASARPGSSGWPRSSVLLQALVRGLGQALALDAVENTFSPKP